VTNFEVDKALADEEYVPRLLETLDKHDLKVWTISCHLTSQAVCDHPSTAAPGHPARADLG